MNNNQNVGKLQTFLQNYGSFLGNCSNNQPNLDGLIKDFITALPPPPQHSTDNQNLQQVYKKGLNLSKQSASDLVTKLRSLKQQKLQQLLTYTQQLNISLNNQYERQINRAIDLGLYNRSNQN